MIDQVNDLFLINGKNENVYQAPTIPENHKSIDVNYDNEDYRASWLITDMKLFLVNAAGRYWIPGRVFLLADWFSGTIRILLGNRISGNEKRDYRLLYEKETYLKIEEGLIVGGWSEYNLNKSLDDMDLLLRNNNEFKKWWNKPSIKPTLASLDEFNIYNNKNKLDKKRYEQIKKEKIKKAQNKTRIDELIDFAKKIVVVVTISFGAGCIFFYMVAYLLSLSIL